MTTFFFKKTILFCFRMADLNFLGIKMFYFKSIFRTIFHKTDQKLLKTKFTWLFSFVFALLAEMRY